MTLTLKEAIQSRKLKLIATELEPLARKDRAVKKIVDTLKKGKEPNPEDITSLKGDTQDDVVLAFASVIGPSQTTKFLGEAKTIKVGEDAVGAKQPHYVIVKDRKVIAKGNKEEMMEKCGDGERVWLSTKDVGDVVEEKGPCWKGYKQVGTKKKNGKEVPNCVPEGKEDPDIGDRKGSQPASYHKGLAASTKEKRDAQFKKQSKMSDDDPDAYKPAPGDKEAKTKPSQYTKKYKDMFGEETLEESNTKKALQKKSEETGVAYSILKDVYDRGVAAWRTGHRPGTTPAQWGMARVNSFVTGGKTQKTTDADLWKKHKGQKEEFEMSDKELTEAVRVDDSRYKRSHKKAPKGKGLWGFTTKPMGTPKERETYIPAMAMDYKQAVEMGKKWADRQGSSVVYVLEANQEDMEPASPDEKSMALKQAEFIQYVGREIGEHLVANKEFPEWMQNKLSALHQKAKDMHATLGAHGGDEMEESVKREEVMSNYNYRTEAHNPMLVSKAVRVAEKMGGDMTGAVEKIEKMGKGLSDHPKVKAALRMANEEFDLTEQKKKKDMTPDELEDELFDMSQLMNMAITDGIWSKSKLINTLATGGFNKAKISKALDMYKKEFDKSPRLMNYEKGVKILKRAKVHEGFELNEKAESEAQAIAARIALKHKREGTKPEPGTASAEMIKMSEKDLEDFTKVKKGAPKKVEEATELMESHFKVGDKVTCIASGMKGEVIKLDEPQTGKYYTVRREDGKVMKYASDELKKVMSEAMDKVNKDALKKKFKDRKDKDIDNDGDVDDSDEYLHNRRKTIAKAVAKEQSEVKLKDKDVDMDGDADEKDKSLEKRKQKSLETE